MSKIGGINLYTKMHRAVGNKIPGISIPEEQLAEQALMWLKREPAKRIPKEDFSSIPCVLISEESGIEVRMSYKKKDPKNILMIVSGGDHFLVDLAKLLEVLKT